MLFGVLATMPFGTIMSYLTIFVIAVFFITSADSATFVLASQSTAGSLNTKAAAPNPKKIVKT